jgi:hypothetical protein
MQFRPSPPHPRSEAGAKLNDLLRVTVSVHWIPLVTAAYGTRVARPARTTTLAPDGDGSSSTAGRGPSSVTIASWARGPRALGSRVERLELHCASCVARGQEATGRLSCSFFDPLVTASIHGCPSLPPPLRTRRGPGLPRPRQAPVPQARTPPALRSSALDGLLRPRLGPRSRAAPSHAATPATAPRAARRERNPLTPSDCFRTGRPGSRLRRHLPVLHEITQTCVISVLLVLCCHADRC